MYLVLLSLLQMGAGALTLGLVQPWGEVLPRWLPLLGGRRVAVRAAVVPAAIGAGLLFLIEGYALLNSLFHFRVSTQTICVLPETGWQVSLLKVAYAPLLAWPLLLTVVTVAYHRRRTGSNAPQA
jgi:hypothetical protein